MAHPTRFLALALLTVAAIISLLLPRKYFNEINKYTSISSLGSPHPIFFFQIHDIELKFNVNFET